MGQNPLAVLAAMLGGGFTGYGQDQEKRTDNARQNRLVGLEFDKLKQSQNEFRANNQLANDRFGLDSELGRGGLGVQRDNLNLNRDELNHRTSLDWANYAQRGQEGDKDRANQRTIYGMGSRNAMLNPQEREAQGAAYIQKWLREGGVPGNPGAGLAYQAMTDVNNLAKRLNISQNEAAYRVAQREQAPGGANWVQRDDPAGGAGARPYVAGGAPPAQQGAGGPPPAPQTKPRTAAEWDAELDRLIDAGENEANILAKLGPRPLQ